jgi:DTW domain-containing protein YfiP
MWQSFGLYHISRLQAAFEFFSIKGIRVIGLATANSNETYQWETVNKATEIELRVAFPNRSYFKILPSEMKQAINSILDEINPNIVVISGCCERSYGLWSTYLDLCFSGVCLRPDKRRRERL